MSMSYSGGVTIGERFPPLPPTIVFTVVILVVIGFTQVLAGITGILWPRTVSETIGLRLDEVMVTSIFFLVVGLASIYAGYLLVRLKRTGVYLAIAIALTDLVFSIVYASSVFLARFYLVMLIVITILLYIGREDLE